MFPWTSSVENIKVSLDTPQYHETKNKSSKIHTHNIDTENPNTVWVQNGFKTGYNFEVKRVNSEKLKLIWN